jgi:MFS family permease
MLTLKRYFKSTLVIPAEHRRNFFHLYMDIGWWGLLNGSVLVFLTIYASRLGASTLQLGLLTASPAAMNLLFTLPAGALIQRVSSKKSLLWSSVLGRIFYLALIPLPVLLPPATQIWVIVIITLLMNIPGTVNAIVFNAFLAEVVPAGYRGYVIGVRNAVFAGTTLITSLAVGLILDRMAFAQGYQIVFFIGCIGALMSTVHLWLIRPPQMDAAAPVSEVTPRIQPEIRQELAAAARATVRASFLKSLRLDVMKGAYGRLMLLIFVFQVGVYLISPVVPKYQVDDLVLSDVTISIGSALFQVTSLIGSLQLRKYAGRWGFKRMTGYGILVVSITLVMFTFAYETWLYWLHQVIGGIGWAFVNGGIINYVLDKVPMDDRASYLAWYNLANNGAILICGFGAPGVAALIGVIPTLLAAAVIRVAVGVLLLRKDESF